MSLPEDDVVFLDDCARNQGYQSRSAVLRAAVRLLRASQLAAAYEAAWQEWETAGEEHVWQAATGDGIEQ